MNTPLESGPKAADVLPLDLRRCTATNRAGERCRRAPIPGGNVCVMHGGRAPQTIAAAKAKLAAARDFAIDYLLRLLEPRPPCEHCGRSDADRDPVVVRAAQIVLDRAGFGPKATLTVDERQMHVVITLPDNGRPRNLPAAELVEDALYLEDGDEVSETSSPQE
jgi:hypothetical protein